MLKTKNDINKYQKIKYYERKKRNKTQKQVLVGVIIIIVAAFFLVLNDNKKSNDTTQRTLDDIHQQIKSLRDEQLRLQKSVEGVGAKITYKQERLKQIQVELAALQPVKQAPVARPAVYTGGVEQWRVLVAKYFPASQVNNALKVMALESNGNPNSLSKTCDRGLMQINCVHANKVGGNLALLFDPDTNIKVAYEIYQASGWYPWSTAKAAGVI